MGDSLFLTGENALWNFARKLYIERE